MTEAYKINIVIGGRTYPVTVGSTSEEQGVRAAAAKIDGLITKFENNYALNDKQDALAMCALQFASVIEVNDVLKKEEEQEIYSGLEAISDKLDSYL